MHVKKSSGDIDVLIVGGGLAGTRAAASAAALGASVTLIEKTGSLGGAASLSNGSVWTFDTADQFLAKCAGASAWLAEMVVGGLSESRTWLRSLGLSLVSKVGGSIYGATQSDTVDVSQLRNVLDRALLQSVRVVREDAVISIEHISGTHHAFETSAGLKGRARAIVLATGGIHADSSQLTDAGLAAFHGFPLRNRRIVGDGMRLALGLGGSRAGNGLGIYGHLVPAGLTGPAVLDALAAQYQSKYGATIGRGGDLLTPLGTDDHDSNRVLAQQTPAIATVVFDANAAVGPPNPGEAFATKRFAFAKAQGCRAAVANTVDDVAATLSQWGYLPLTVNAHAALRQTLQATPFFLIEVEPSITHAGVGVHVSEDLVATTANGSTLPGIFVAGQDVGGAFGAGYGGGLALALTSGQTAGRLAAASAQREDAGNAESR